MEYPYTSLIRPSFEYVCSLCDPSYKGEIDQFEMVKRKDSSPTDNETHAV